MIRKLFLASALALLAACGGGDAAAPLEHSDNIAPVAIPFGWWNGPAAGGSLAIAVPGDYPAAVARGQTPIVIVWTTILRDGQLVAGWREALRAMIAATPQAAGYYAFDEPGIYEVADAVQDAVIAELPPDKIIMLSLSWPELVNHQYVSPKVTLLGANLYASMGIAPSMALAHLERLAAYKRPMYLNLDATWIAGIGADCKTIPDENQRASIALNDAIIAWGQGRDIRAYVAFLWASVSGGDFMRPICGAEDMPLIRSYMRALGGGQ